MSFDLECYLTPSDMPLPETVDGLTWQLAVYPPTPIDAEDMEPALLQAIGGRSHLVNLHLEGQTTSKADDALIAMINTLISDHNSVLYDPQGDEVISQSGTVPLERAPAKPKSVPLKMTFLYRCAPEGRDALREQYLDALQDAAPKAMPRRYGSYEPMPFTYADTGRAHFLEDWGKEDGFYFWRGHAPYQWSYQSANDPNDKRPSQVGRFRSCCSTIEISPRILTTKKDKADMMRLFEALSVALDVYYAELAPESDGDSYGDWRGMPSRLPLASCIGQAYAALWPDYARGAEQLGTSHWVRDTVIAGKIIPAPPSNLLAPDKPDPMNNPLNSKRGYAPIFPFEVPEAPVHSSRR